MTYTQLAFALALSTMLAASSLAQVPQSLGAADASQQLKYSGMNLNPAHPDYPFTAPFEDRPDPLITVIDEPPRETRFERRIRSRTESRVRAQARARAEAPSPWGHPRPRARVRSARR